MAEQAKVSVIVPVYNVEPYLEEALTSIIGQDLKELEIICVNDGSTDRSPEILRAFAKKDSRIVVIDRENGGYGRAMNLGLDRASGEYVGIVEPDDYIVPEMYGDLYRIASQNNADVVKADFCRFVRENGEQKDTYVHLTKDKSAYNRVVSAWDDPKILRYVMNTWSGIYRRAFLEEHHIRHHETPGASFQDNGFWFQTFTLAKRLYFVDHPYYRNRRDNPNSSVHNRAKVYCMNEEYDWIYQFMEAHPKLKERFIYEYSRKRYFNYQFTLNRIGEEFRREYINRISKELARSLKKGEFRKDDYTSVQWDAMQILLEDPEGYYYYHKYDVEKLRRDLERTADRLDRIEHGKSYKIGRAVTKLPRMLRGD